MTMIARAMKITGLKTEINSTELRRTLKAFNDYKEVALWAQESVVDCVKSGIVAGKNHKMMAPKEKIKRAEVATIIKKLLKKSLLI